MNTDPHLRTGIIKAVKNDSLILEMNDTGELIIWPMTEDAFGTFKEVREIKLEIQPCSQPAEIPPIAIDNVDNEERRKLLEQLVN
ncbi:hypothetical protein KJ951_01280 [Patescibacteria group bacterium]|nr:hypothetical protein [Patescibacteria group bacterium]MBU1703013.1 hypothetical protein [Patescibacteria group bacterium]MBU1954045.1 hypothetical protein [Patescibacteria group bacterium]